MKHRWQVVGLSAGIAVFLRWVALGFPLGADFRSYWRVTDWEGSDAHLFMGITKMMVEEGWLPWTAVTSLRMGWPEGFAIPQMPFNEIPHHLFANFITWVSGDPVVGYNLFFLLAAGLLAGSMTWVAQRLGMPRIESVSLGLLFAALPIAFERHSQFAMMCNFQIPFFLFFLLRADAEKYWRTFAVTGLLAGMTGIYMAFFGLLLAGLVTLPRLFLAIFKRQTTRIRNFVLNGAVFVTGVVLTVGLSLLPNELYSWEHGRTNVFDRNPSESLIWAMRPANVLLPQLSHPLPTHSPWRSFFFQSDYLRSEADYEGFAEYTGFLSWLGIGIGLVLIFRRKWSSPEDRAVIFLACLGLLAFWLGVRNGLGTWIAYNITPQIRSYNRVSIFIAAAGSMAAFVWLSFGVRRRFPAPKASWVMIGLGVFAMLDLGTFWRPVKVLAEEANSDRQFAAMVQAVLVDRPVLHLPYGAFPEWKGYPSVEVYAPFRQLMHAPIRSVYPTAKGTPASDQKLRRFFGRVPQRGDLIQYGISGVIIDRKDFKDAGAEAIQALTMAGDRVEDSPDGRFRLIAFSSAAK